MKRIINLRIVISAIFSLISVIALSQINNVGIGTLTPHPSALLELQSIDKGILIPRIADTNNVASPAKGLLIYLNTNNTFYYFDGAFWKSIIAGIGPTGPTGAQGAIGPSGTDGATGANGTTVLSGTGATSAVIVINGAGDIIYKNSTNQGVVLIDNSILNPQCWKMTVDSLGNITTQLVICP